jgi:hypothetical protein
MANTAAYMAGRQKYQRPQGMLWAENSGTLVLSNPSDEDSIKTYIPIGYEIGADTADLESTEDQYLNNFLILTDDNRKEFKFNTTRIENRERMINGRMRSYHVADKLSISTSWTNIPSRSHTTIPDFALTTVPNPNPLLPNLATVGKAVNSGNSSYEYTTDGGAGGAELLDWYENHKGSFWVYLSYDKYPNFGSDADAKTHMAQYGQVVEMFISNFEYSVNRRGGLYDFWDVSVTLEEV